MEIQFKLLDKNNSAFIPEKIRWVNFHMTKHLILGFHSEGYNNRIAIDEEKINSIREKQIDSFGCKIKDRLQSIRRTCEQCDYQQDCNNLLSDLKSSYYSLIKNTLVNDVKKPRHAHFYDIKYKMQTLSLVAENGTIVVATKKKPTSSHYRIKTCFREQYHVHPSFRILASDDDHWFRINAIKFYDKKLYDKQLCRSVEKILMENWTNA